MIEIKITGTTPLEALASVTAFGDALHEEPGRSCGGYPCAGDRGSKVSKSDTALTAPMAPAAPAVSLR